VTGTVTYIGVDQTQPVKLGQILVQLDSQDADVSLGQAKANLAQTVRDVVQLFADERRQEAVLYAQQAQLTLANQELARDRGLIGFARDFTGGTGSHRAERAKCRSGHQASAGISRVGPGRRSQARSQPRIRGCCWPSRT